MDIEQEIVELKKRVEQLEKIEESKREAEISRLEAEQERLKENMAIDSLILSLKAPTAFDKHKMSAKNKKSKER